MPTTSGLTSAPLTRVLILLTVSTAILTTILDAKHQFTIALPILHRLPLRSVLIRIFTYQLSYTNSADVLFAALTAYHLRIIERIWGTRKMASFVLAVLPYTTFVPLAVLYAANLLSWGTVDRIPSGMTAILWALVAQWHAAVPYAYRYRVSAPTPVRKPANSSSSAGTSIEAGSESASEENEDVGILLTSKSLSYLPPLQLAFSALPGSLIPAAIGWCVGYAWRWELLPFPRSTNWRIPERAWKLLGGSGTSPTAAGEARVEDMRRRMAEGDEDGATGRASGSRPTAGFGVENILGARTSGRRNS